MMNPKYTLIAGLLLVTITSFIYIAGSGNLTDATSVSGQQVKPDVQERTFNSMQNAADFTGFSLPILRDKSWHLISSRVIKLATESHETMLTTLEYEKEDDRIGLRVLPVSEKPINVDLPGEQGSVNGTPATVYRNGPYVIVAWSRDEMHLQAKALLTDSFDISGFWAALASIEYLAP